MSLGVHFALDSATETRVLALAEAGNDEALLELLAEIEETWHERRTCHHDKAWDALHRTLTDGKLEYANGTYPLGAAVLGGRQLIAGEREYTISYLSASQVRDVTEALDVIEEDWFRQRYFALGETDYYGPVDEDDLDYTWADFSDTREFFARSAEAGLAVIFTVDA
jgi:hypothetical protein